MTDTNFKISRVSSGEEVRTAWEEAGQVLPNPEAWMASVESGVHDAIVARLGSRAVGYVLIRGAGPNPNVETEFYRIISENFESPLPPAIQWLYVDAAQRGRGFGRGLLEAAHQRIIDRDDLPNHGALTVNVDEEVALGLYESAGYYTLRASDGSESFSGDYPMWDDKKGEWVSDISQSVVMVKELK
jgi:ribosomal protein S18 acetylase RimI-like enzyme